jgi:hypothetical protein
VQSTARRVSDSFARAAFDVGDLRCFLGGDKRTDADTHARGQRDLGLADLAAFCKELPNSDRINRSFSSVARFQIDVSPLRSPAYCRLSPTHSILPLDARSYPMIGWSVGWSRWALSVAEHGATTRAVRSTNRGYQRSAAQRSSNHVRDGATEAESRADPKPIAGGNRTPGLFAVDGSRRGRSRPRNPSLARLADDEAESDRSATVPSDGRRGAIFGSAVDDDS